MKIVKNMTDRQWCLWLENRYGELMAMTIYDLFPDKDGTAPESFTTHIVEKNHACARVA